MGHGESEARHIVLGASTSNRAVRERSMRVLAGCRKGGVKLVMGSANLSHGGQGWETLSEVDVEGMAICGMFEGGSKAASGRFSIVDGCSSVLVVLGGAFPGCPPLVPLLGLSCSVTAAKDEEDE